MVPRLALNTRRAEGPAWRTGKLPSLGRPQAAPMQLACGKGPRQPLNAPCMRHQRHINHCKLDQGAAGDARSLGERPENLAGSADSPTEVSRGAALLSLAATSRKTTCQAEGTWRAALPLVLSSYQRPGQRAAVCRSRLLIPTKTFARREQTRGSEDMHIDCHCPRREAPTDLVRRAGSARRTSWHSL